MRTAAISRKTKETQIEVRLNLDGTGRCAVHTGIGFFDHMLEQIARHGLMDLDVKVEGDLYVDGHHTVEDAGIVLGQALKEALGEKRALCVTDKLVFRSTNLCLVLCLTFPVVRGCILTATLPLR